jgi:hypothetical protein
MNTIKILLRMNFQMKQLRGGRLMRQINYREWKKLNGLMSWLFALTFHIKPIQASRTTQTIPGYHLPKINLRRGAAII